MNPEETRRLRQLMAWEARRTAVPEGFPAFPDLPAGRYLDTGFFELEQTRLWRRCWLLAGHADELPEVGSFRRWDLAGEPVVLVRADDGAINAFYNSCRHRGAPVALEASGCSRRLTCRYHGWSYDHRGKLVAIRERRDFPALDLAARSLEPIRCESFGKLVFVNFDSAAEPLLDWLGPIADEWREFQFDRCRLAARAVFDLHCNWKVAMEANLEVYHVPTVHPGTVAPILDPRRNVNTLYPRGHGRMVAPNPRHERPSRPSDSTSSPRPQFDTVGEIARTCTQSYNVFPNLVAPLNQYVLPPILFWPNGIDRCRIETWTLAPDWGDGAAPDMWTADGGERLGDVLLEDTGFCEQVQAAMQCSAFRGIALGYQEARIYHWHQAADRFIGVDQVPPPLRVAPVIGPEWIHPNDPRLAALEHTP